MKLKISLIGSCMAGVEIRAKWRCELSLRFNPCHFEVLLVRPVVALDHKWKIFIFLEFI